MNKTIEQIVEEIARKHFGVGSFEKTGYDPLDYRNISILSIKTALNDALKTGEKLGYDEGKRNCKCS